MRYLAFVGPIENHVGVKQVMCQVKVLTGDRAHKTYKMMMPTDIFKYYFWGVTLEIIEMDSKGNLLKVYDIDSGAKEEFNIGMAHALTYNEVSHEILASNGFVYNIDDSLFARYCMPVCKRIYDEIARCSNFAIQFYTYNGAMLCILFDRNVLPTSPMYKYVLNRGFIVADRKKLCGMSPANDTNVYDYDKNQKLKQSDIDNMVKDMLKTFKG